MSAAFDALREQVTQSISVQESAILLIQGLYQKLLDAIAAGDPAALQALADEIAAEKDRLAEAVAANTPAA